MRRRFLFLVPLSFLACENTPEPVAPPPPPPVVAAPPPPPPPAPMFDPLAAGLTADGQRHLCDDHLAEAQKLADGIRALAGATADKLTYEATLGRFDDIIVETRDAQELPHLMALAHPAA